MASANTKALTCSSCGGQIQYNYTQDTSKCLYCGTEFKKDKPQKPRREHVDMEPTFVEVPAALPTPEENSIVYNIMFKQRPSFWKAMLRGLAFWAAWFIIAAMIQGFSGAIRGKEFGHSLFISEPGDGFWFCRGLLFCLVYPILKYFFGRV